MNTPLAAALLAILALSGSFLSRAFAESGPQVGDPLAVANELATRALRERPAKVVLQVSKAEKAEPLTDPQKERIGSLTAYVWKNGGGGQLIKPVAEALGLDPLDFPKTSYGGVYLRWVFQSQYTLTPEGDKVYNSQELKNHFYVIEKASKIGGIPCSGPEPCSVPRYIVVSSDRGNRERIHFLSSTTGDLLAAVLETEIGPAGWGKAATVPLEPSRKEFKSNLEFWIAHHSK